MARVSGQVGSTAVGLVHWTMLPGQGTKGVGGGMRG